MLDKFKIKSYLKSKAEIIVYDSVDSTNLRALELANGGFDKPAVIAADLQTNGRGRQGKSFYSPAGTGLYLSVLIHPNLPLGSVVTVTSAAAVAVSRAIEALTPLKPQIKWVNDIYLDGRKACGILTQSVSQNGLAKSIVVGVGINISTDSFPDEIKDSAASLNFEIEREALAAEIADNIFEYARNPFERRYMDEYKKRSCVIGRKIVYYENGAAHSAAAVGIDENGGLIVESDGKEKILTSGEITLRLAENK